MALLLVMWCVRGGLLATVDFILTVGQYQCFRHGSYAKTLEQKEQRTDCVCVVVFFSLLQRSVWRAAVRGMETAPNLASVCKY